MGAQWSAVTLVGASGALVMGAARDLVGDYRLPLAVAAGSLAIGAALTMAAGKVAQRVE